MSESSFPNSSPSDMSNLPPPYTMCSREEFQNRLRTGEIAVFERRLDNQFDPQLAVSKYRRSAAGTTQHYPPRSIPQLERAVHYLLSILIAAPTKAANDQPLTSYLHIVEFVQDRVRAVQVDLVLSQQSVCAKLQYQLVRMHVLVSYLLQEHDEYSHKLGQDALHTALYRYWDDDTQNDEKLNDEMISFMLLRSMQWEECGVRMQWHNFLPFYKKCQNTGPYFQWTLRLVERLYIGHWQAALRMLQEGTDGFGVLVRCWMAPYVAFLRWKALEAYNFTWGKGEAVPIADLARLLRFRQGRDDMDEVAASDFCSRVGLPVDDSGVAFRFKVAPLQPLPNRFFVNKREDGFILQLDPCDDSRFDRAGMPLPSARWMQEFLFPNTNNSLN